MTKARALKAPTGIATGLNKGYTVTKRVTKKAAGAAKPTSDRVRAVRSIIRETCGFAAYEKRIMEILKGGGNNPTKRAYKYSKNKLGSHIRAKRKVKEMEDAIAARHK